MRRGYIRLSKAGPGLLEQQDALRRSGVTDFGKDGPVYVDEAPKGRHQGAESMPQRGLAIRSLRAGDELVVASAARLAVGRADLIQVLQQVGARGAAIYDVAAGEAIRWHEDALSCLSFVERAEAEQRREVTAKMRRAKAELGVPSGPPKKLGAKEAEEAKRLWSDHTLSAAQVADAVGVTRRTLYRMFGPRAGESPVHAVKNKASK